MPSHPCLILNRIDLEMNIFVHPKPREKQQVEKQLLLKFSRSFSFLFRWHLLSKNAFGHMNSLFLTCSFFTACYRSHKFKLKSKIVTKSEYQLWIGQSRNMRVDEVWEESILPKPVLSAVEVYTSLSRVLPFWFQIPYKHILNKRTDELEKKNA